MVPLSILDLSPIVEGGDAGQSLRNSLDLAGYVEALGYGRYWMAEHHNLPGIASAATAVALAHVAAGTERITIGAGGIMLPNHAPLMVAEQFGTLAALHPGRVELGLGRAPGSDQLTMRAMRRNLLANDDQFPRDVVELMGYFRAGRAGPAAASGAGGRARRADLDFGVEPLRRAIGRDFGAAVCLRLAFRAGGDDAGDRDLSRALPALDHSSPRRVSCSGATVVAADTDGEARYLFSSLQQATLNNRTGRPTRVPPPVADFEATLDPYMRAVVDDAFGAAIVGGPETVRRGLEDFVARTGADELMVTANIYDHDKRKRSFAIIAEVGGVGR